MGFINLTDLPQEILGRVFTFLEPSDVARVGQTCTQLGNFTSPSNQLLWVSTQLQTQKIYSQFPGAS